MQNTLRLFNKLDFAFHYSLTNIKNPPEGGFTFIMSVEKNKQIKDINNIKLISNLFFQNSFQYPCEYHLASHLEFHRDNHYSAETLIH